MQTELQRYLDGEIGREELTPESLREADRFEQWNRTLGIAARERTPAWLENRIMVSLPPRPSAPLGIRLGAWLIEPRRIRIRPLPIGLAGAGALVLALLALPFERSVLPEVFGPANPAVVSVSSAPQVYVQFELSAPQARSVALAGDFNNWQPDGISLRDPDGDRCLDCAHSECTRACTGTCSSSTVSIGLRIRGRSAILMTGMACGMPSSQWPRCLRGPFNL